MPAERPLGFAVACEDRGHYSAVTHLVDRRLADSVSWAADILEHVRGWISDDGDHPWFALKAARERARTLRLPIHGHFGDRPGLPDAVSVRAQLLYLAALKRRGTPIDAVLLVRDLDHRPERLDGMLQAIGASRWPFAVLVGWCEPEIEAWKIGCFLPGDAAEHERLTTVRRKLSFCPATEPERLTSTARDSARDAKKIARELFDEARGWRCLDLPFEVLRDRGRSTGLAGFLDEVDAKLVPLLAGRPRDA